jgi:hypothetical protein
VVALWQREKFSPVGNRNTGRPARDLVKMASLWYHCILLKTFGRISRSSLKPKLGMNVTPHNLKLLKMAVFWFIAPCSLVEVSDVLAVSLQGDDGGLKRL